MPHDVNGNALKIGDLVYVPCVVKHLDATDEFCNVTLETTEPMHPSPHPTSIVLNTIQTVYMGDA